MDNLHKLLEKTLLKMEYEALDKDKFWLDHMYLLKAQDWEIKEFLDLPIFENHPLLCEHGFNHCMFDPIEDTYACTACGLILPPWLEYIEKERPDSCFYKHKVHLHQILHELQCLRHKLDWSMIEDIRHHLKENFTYERIRKSLRQCGYRQHYRMIPSIQQALDPTFKPLHLNPDKENEIQKCFYKYLQCGEKFGRKNKLNYHFIIYKICQFLGYDWVLPHLHLPKGKATLQKLEKCWIDIVKFL